jgi:hypothetical protein
MKNKLFLLTSIFYTLINFIILDYIIYNNSDGFEPFYYDLIHLIKGDNMVKIYYKLKIFAINILPSTIFFYIMYKWYLKEKIIITFLRLIIYFVLINLCLYLILYLIRDFATYIFFITLFTIPTLIMLALIFPLFWISNKIIEKK